MKLKDYGIKPPTAALGAIGTQKRDGRLLFADRRAPEVVTSSNMLRRTFLQFSLALRKERLDRVEAILKEATDSGSVLLGVRLGAARQGRAPLGMSARRARPIPSILLASITKPMTVAGVMVLADRGELKLSDPGAQIHPRVPRRRPRRRADPPSAHPHLRASRHAA